MTLLDERHALIVELLFVYGMTQTDAAEAAGLSQGSVSRVRSRFLLELAVILGPVAAVDTAMRREVVELMVGRAAVVRGEGGQNL